jgi:hypothetical protein
LQPRSEVAGAHHFEGITVPLVVVVVVADISDPGLQLRSSHVKNYSTCNVQHDLYRVCEQKWGASLTLPEWIKYMEVLYSQ